MLKDRLLDIKKQIIDLEKSMYELNALYHGTMLQPSKNFIEENNYESCYDFRFDSFDYTEGNVSYTFLDNKISDKLYTFFGNKIDKENYRFSNSISIEQFCREFEVIEDK